MELALQKSRVTALTSSQLVLTYLGQRLLILLAVTFDNGAETTRSAVVNASLALAAQDIHCLRLNGSLTLGISLR